MTRICCNWLAEVDIGYNPIIIVLQPSKFIVTIVIFPLIPLVIITLQFLYHVLILTWTPVTNRMKRGCSIFKPTEHHTSVRAHCPTTQPVPPTRKAHHPHPTTISSPTQILPQVGNRTMPTRACHEQCGLEGLHAMERQR
jgi:hypothetical protein